MKTFIVLFFILIVNLSANTSLEKHLKSEIRAEVYAQNLIEGGYNTKAHTFIEKALLKYKKNEALLMFNATSLYHLKKLQEAKNYFKLTLEVNPSNEQASKFIELINAQENSKQNHVISNVIDYLSDKGLDFIMIFLAFLGGEIIAKKYTKCSKNTITLAIEKYKNRKKLSLKKGRISFAFKHMISNIFSFCTVLETLVILTIVIALLIVLLMTEFLSGFTFFVSESFTTLSETSIWEHTGIMFFALLFITLVLRFIMIVLEYEDNKELYLIEVVEQLERLFANKSYVLLYKALEKLNEEDLQQFEKYLSLEFKEYYSK